VSAFTTAGLGVIADSGGDVDNVVRQHAWLKAHPGGTTAAEQQHDRLRIVVYTARWADGSLAASSPQSLGALMNALDAAEAAGRCPVVHPEPSSC
jgi:hypothetical protein